MTANRAVSFDAPYSEFVAQVVGLLEQARRNSARSVNSIMTATYWEIGCRIVEHEQKGKKRAEYGKALLHRLAEDLTARFGKGFSERNLLAMREFYRARSIPQTLPAELSEPGGSGNSLPNPQTPSAESGGRQLGRWIATQFFERTELSRNKAAILRQGHAPEPTDPLAPEQEIKDPPVLEFLGLKDEHFENALEEALVHRLEHFLLELGRFRPHYVTWSEQQRIENSAVPHLRNAIRIISETGLRVKKELLPMKKDQIDFINGVLWIPDSKTPNGVAEIPSTKLALEAFRNQIAISGDGEYLFPNDRNKTGHLHSLRTAWRKALKSARVAYFRIYDLRSTYATRLSAGGVADEWVIQMLRQGDSQVKYLLKRCSSLTVLAPQFSPPPLLRKQQVQAARLGGRNSNEAQEVF